VAVGSFFFNAYFKVCNVNAPCKLQEGVGVESQQSALNGEFVHACPAALTSWSSAEYDNLKKKYMVLFRALLASGRNPDAVEVRDSIGSLRD
jgi:hypothetical protein